MRSTLVDAGRFGNEADLQKILKIKFCLRTLRHRHRDPSAPTPSINAQQPADNDPTTQARCGHTPERQERDASRNACQLRRASRHLAYGRGI
jgi:hypothetical protein